MIDNNTYCLSSGHFSKHLANHGLNLEEYVLKYEPPKERVKCKCGDVTKLAGNDGVNWTFLRVCGKSECAKKARSDGLRGMDPVRRKETMGAKAKATLNADPERKARAIANTIAGNSKVGADGLTGYERTAKKRAETSLKKYGRADYAGWDKAKETFNNRTDEERAVIGKRISDGWKNMSDIDKALSKQRRRHTNIERHGMECPANKAVFIGYSKLAASLFEQLDIDENGEFKPKCKEHSVCGKIFDFRYNNKLIEFNGDYWHANPIKYQPEDLIGRNGKRLAKDIWEADARKVKLAEDNGYEVKIVWESEYKRSPEKVVKECLEWLKS